jgi:phosphoribosyl-AMP cyclohydrolase
MNKQMEPKFDSNGLIPAIIQDNQSGTVLMMAWMNKEAFQLTRKTHQVHFWSRSRQELWRKGASSGNTLRMHAMWLDCDGDTVLLKVDAAGPVCHTGNPNCFFNKIS